MNDDDVKVPNIPNIKQPEIIPNDIENKPEPQIEPKPEPEQKKEPKPEDVVCTEWKCPKCSTVNELAYKFCPKCGCNKKEFEQSKPPHMIPPHITTIPEDDKKPPHMTLNEIVLKKVSVINDGHYSPNEQRQTGWIVKNITNKNINIKAKLIKLGGDKNVEVKYEEIIQFQMKPNDEMFILIEVKAPSLPNQYHMFYQLIMLNDDNSNTQKKICDVLQLKVWVKKQFEDVKENKIKQIFEMGFNDRTRIVTALKKWNWDQVKAINWLATH